MALEAAGHFRQYTAKRRTAMFTKTCPALKKKKSFETKNNIGQKVQGSGHKVRNTELAFRLLP